MTADRAFDLVLVFSGGNALGAFQAGVYEALDEQGLAPDWMIGASIGAINAAVIAGTAREDRLAALRDIWRPQTPMPLDWTAPWLSGAMETGRRTSAVTWTVAAGRRGLFGPALSALLPWTDDKPSLFETEQLRETLARTIDFDRLNAGPCRFTATAVDLESGDDVVFDSRERRIGPDHIRASAALPVFFPPVAIDGRWLVDGGIAANLPLDPVLADPPPRPTLCIAVDLLPLDGARPATLGEAASRMQDLMFAAQSRRTIARWRAAYAGRTDRQVSLVRVPYTEQQDEVAGKALDFSARTIEQRWAAGLAAGRRVVARLQAGRLSIGVPGLTVVAPDDD